MECVAYHKVKANAQRQWLECDILKMKEYCTEEGIALYKNKVFTDLQRVTNEKNSCYQTLKEEVLKSGDALLINTTEALGGSTEEILQELYYFRDNGIRLMILDRPTTLQNLSGLNGTITAMLIKTMNGILVESYAALVKAEQERREKYRHTGMRAPKDYGEYSPYGRPRKQKFSDFVAAYSAVVTGEMKPFELMKKLGLTKPTFYRYKKQYEENKIKQQGDNNGQHTKN